MQYISLSTVTEAPRSRIEARGNAGYHRVVGEGWAIACARLVKGKTIRWWGGGMVMVKIDNFLRSFAEKWSREN